MGSSTMTTTDVDKVENGNGKKGRGLKFWKKKPKQQQQQQQVQQQQQAVEEERDAPPPNNNNNNNIDGAVIPSKKKKRNMKSNSNTNTNNTSTSTPLKMNTKENEAPLSNRNHNNQESPHKKQSKNNTSTPSSKTTQRTKKALQTPEPPMNNNNKNNNNTNNNNTFSTMKQPPSTPRKRSSASYNTNKPSHITSSTSPSTSSNIGYLSKSNMAQMNGTPGSFHHSTMGKSHTSRDTYISEQTKKECISRLQSISKKHVKGKDFHDSFSFMNSTSVGTTSIASTTANSVTHTHNSTTHNTTNTTTAAASERLRNTVNNHRSNSDTSDADRKIIEAVLGVNDTACGKRRHGNDDNNPHSNIHSTETTSAAAATASPTSVMSNLPETIRNKSSQLATSWKESMNKLLNCANLDDLTFIGDDNDDTTYTYTHTADGGNGIGGNGGNGETGGETMGSKLRTFGNGLGSELRQDLCFMNPADTWENYNGGHTNNTTNTTSRTRPTTRDGFDDEQDREMYEKFMKRKQQLVGDESTEEDEPYHHEHHEHHDEEEEEEYEEDGSNSRRGGGGGNTGGGGGEGEGKSGWSILDNSTTCDEDENPRGRSPTSRPITTRRDTDDDTLDRVMKKFSVTDNIYHDYHNDDTNNISGKYAPWDEGLHRTITEDEAELPIRQHNTSRGGAAGGSGYGLDGHSQLSAKMEGWSTQSSTAAEF